MTDVVLQDKTSLLAGMVRYTPVEGEDLDMVPDAVGAYVRYDAVLALVAAAYAGAGKAIVDLGAYATNGFKAASVPDTFDEGTCAAHDAVEILAQSDPHATAALARMLADARAEGLEVALGAIAAIPTPAIEDQARGHEDAYRAVEAIRAMKGGQP